MIWEVFRLDTSGDSHVHCGNVHATDREMAKQFAVIQHGRRKPTRSVWVTPQDEVVDVDFSLDGGAASVDGTTWRVFRQDEAGGYHTHCGSVTAPDATAAQRAALAAYADDDPHSLWVAPGHEIGEITDEHVAFGGTTDKSYRFAQTYNVRAAAAEVEASENEQIEAERRRGES